MTKDEFVQIVERAAASEDVPATALLAIANLESSGNVNAKNSRSSASGAFQFTDATAREYGLTGSKRNDPTAQAYAAAKMMATNMRALTRVLGREPDAGELYLAHQQGLGGATALLQNKDRPAVEALTRVYGSRAKAEQAILLNGGSLNMTSGEFSSRWVDKANQTAARIPPGSIPNTVGSEVDTARVAPTPAPLSQRPTAIAARQYEYAPNGRPRDPDNGFLMDEKDPRYPEAAAGSPNASVRATATASAGAAAGVPLPRARPASPMDIASAPGTTVATVPTVQRQMLPPLAPPTPARQVSAPVPVAPRQAGAVGAKQATPTAEQVRQATGFRVDVAPRQSVPLTIGAQSSYAALEGAKARDKQVPGPSSAPKSEDRVLPSPPGLEPRGAQPSKQQVEAATGFRLPNSSPLTEEVEVENPAYAALMKRVQQGEIELRGLTPSGMPLSRDGRARWEASKAALEAKLAAQRAELAKMQPRVTVTRAAPQPAPLKIVVQGSGASAGVGAASGAMTPVQRLQAQGLSPAQAYDEANRQAADRARANSPSGSRPRYNPDTNSWS